MFFSAYSKDRNPQNLNAKGFEYKKSPTKTHQKKIIGGFKLSNFGLLCPRRQQCVDQLSSYWQQCRQLLQAWNGHRTLGKKAHSYGGILKKWAGIAQTSLNSVFSKKTSVFFWQNFSHHQAEVNHHYISMALDSGLILPSCARSMYAHPNIQTECCHVEISRWRITLFFEKHVNYSLYQTEI